MTNAKGLAMLRVVEDIYEGGKDIIRNWRLLDHAKEALAKGGPKGLRDYYERCLRMTSPKAQWVKESLERHGRRTRESEYERFVAAFQS
jgi:hypothetical protein